MGDDLPDLAVLRRVGYPMAPANAVAEVKAAARFVTTRAGGRGAVREAVEHLMRQAGQWDSVLSGYDAVALSTSEVKRGTAQ
jgi:3-deoxy-D-manno-octulosonate 8-phosphate phosphatase (KDO 8-P phosphatase)